MGHIYGIMYKDVERLREDLEEARNSLDCDKRWLRKLVVDSRRETMSTRKGEVERQIRVCKEKKEVSERMVANLEKEKERWKAMEDATENKDEKLKKSIRFGGKYKDLDINKLVRQ